MHSLGDRTGNDERTASVGIVPLTVIQDVVAATTTTDDQFVTPPESGYRGWAIGFLPKGTHLTTVCKHLATRRGDPADVEFVRGS